MTAFLLALFIILYIAFTIYAFYDMLVNGSLGLFVFNLIGYIVFLYLLNKSIKEEKQRVWEKKNDGFEITHEEPSIDDLSYEEHSYADDSSIYKEECLMDESRDFDVYLDKNVGKLTEWQDTFFRGS